jgi:hypothetical protein
MATQALKFRYTVTARGNKTLTGVISAVSLDSAQKNLEKLGYTVLTLSPVVATLPTEKGKKVFSFEARNEQGKKILGTIAAATEILARKKLEQDHGLTILQLQPIQTEGVERKDEKKVFFAEAEMVIQKAEQVLQEISPYDADYNAIFDAKEDLRYLVKMGDVRSVEKRMVEVLKMLQEKERVSLVEEKAVDEEQILQQTSDLMTSIKIETEESSKNIPNMYVNAVVEELRILSGWLLAFYGFYFVLAEMVIFKHLSFGGFLFLQNTLLSPLLYKIAIAVLLLHLYCWIKLSWLEKKLLSGLLLFVVILLLILWTFLI